MGPIDYRRAPTLRLTAACSLMGTGVLAAALGFVAIGIGSTIVARVLLVVFLALFLFGLAALFRGGEGASRSDGPKPRRGSHLLTGKM